MRSLADFPDAHLRIFDRPAPPSSVREVYLIGICGTGMGSLAGLLTKAGYTVRGSDANVWPPMSTHLASLDITVHEGFDPSHLDYGPDLVIVGNACTPTHVEAAAARERQLPQCSFPEALADFFLRKKRSLVVAGTHGKTTTTGLLIHLMQSQDPGYLVGGILSGKDASYGLGNGAHFIVEGDEYDSAYFDKQPKFLHYQPRSALVTSLELDHTDIYDSMDQYREAFRLFSHSVEDTLSLCDDDPEVLELAKAADASVRTYGLSPTSDVTATDLRILPHGQEFLLSVDGTPANTLLLPLFGRHNLLNALGACSIALAEGIPARDLSFDGYEGMKRRMEVLDNSCGITVVDDFAHHPTAVRATIQGARDRWPSRRLVAVFEPRTNTSRRKMFESTYTEAFDEADSTLISAPPFRHNDDPNQFMDISTVVSGISERGTPAAMFSNSDEVLSSLLEDSREGDVILIMSNGGFGGLHRRLIQALHDRV